MSVVVLISHMLLLLVTSTLFNPPFQILNTEDLLNCLLCPQSCHLLQPETVQTVYLAWNCKGMIRIHFLYFPLRSVFLKSMMAPSPHNYLIAETVRAALAVTRATVWDSVFLDNFAFDALLF